MKNWAVIDGFGIWDHEQDRKKYCITDILKKAQNYYNIYMHTKSLSISFDILGPVTYLLWKLVLFLQISCPVFLA